jgi:hypothetical protein
MQTHFECTVHAHFRLLRRLLGRAGKVRFFFDLDDTIRAACLSTFKGEIREGKGSPSGFAVRCRRGGREPKFNTLGSRAPWSEVNVRIVYAARSAIEFVTVLRKWRLSYAITAKPTNFASIGGTALPII